MGEVSTLDHKIRDDAVELRPLEVQRLAVDLSHSLLPCAQGAEVFSSLRDSLAEQSHQQSSNWGTYVWSVYVIISYLSSHTIQ